MTLLLALACAGDGPDDSVPADDTAPAGPVALTDASNYSYTSALDIGSVPIGVGAESAVDWSGLTVDMRGFPVDPSADVNNVGLVWFRNRTETEIAEALVSGEITQASVGLFATLPTGAGETSLLLSSLDLYGVPFDPEAYMVVEGGSWLLRISTHQNEDAMLLFVDPPEGESTVYVGDDSATLDFRPDLASLAPVRLTDRTVEWTGLTRDGRGAALDPLALQELWIARYDGYDVATLQERFFEIETLPTNTWTANVYGETSVDLGTALDAGGGAFSGVTDDATWLLALRCIVCTSPAPVYLTVVTP